MKKIFLIAVMLFITGLSYGQQKNSSHTKNESTSVSISNSDYNYTLKASFNTNKYEKLKSVIIKALGKATENKNEENIWQLNDIYIVSLKNDKLSIKLDKEKATASLYKEISKLGQDIQQSLNKSSNTEVSN